MPWLIGCTPGSGELAIAGNIPSTGFLSMVAAMARGLMDIWR